MSTTVERRLHEPIAPTRNFRSNAIPDRIMRRIFGVKAVDLACGRGAHNAFRTSVLVSGIRCIITYMLIPIVIPMMSLAGWVAAPVGIALCVVAVLNGLNSMRRFWRSDHPQRWVYTAFMGVVFIILGIALVSDFSRLGAML